MRPYPAPCSAIVRLALAALALTPIALPASAAETGPAGNWKVTGDIAGHAFALNCHFEPKAGALAGTCTELAGTDGANGKGSPGKVHVLTKGAVAGSAVSWAYGARALLLSITVSFTGTQDGARITGTTSAAGRGGSFTATRI